jgi:hypothetical protein
MSAFVFHLSHRRIPGGYRLVSSCLISSFHTMPVQQKFRYSFLGEEILCGRVFVRCMIMMELLTP